MKRRFYLHVGGHKTGSSAQQVWFANNGVALNAAGLVYPAEITGAHGNCVRIAEAWGKDPNTWSAQNALNMMQFSELIEEHPHLDVLFSAEYFSEDSTERHLTAVAADLSEYGFEVRPVMYVRNQIDQLSSLYAQRIKLLNTDLSFDCALRELTSMQRADWHRYFERHSALGWSTAIGAFGRKREHSIVESFFALAGLKDRFPVETDFRVDEINPSLGAIGVLVSLHVARHIISRRLSMPHNGNVYFSRCLIAASAEIEDRRFIGPDKSDREYIRARYASGNQAIAKLLPDDETALLLTEQLPEGPASPRTFAELSATDRARAEACMELCRAKLLDYTPIHRFLSPEMIRQIPRIS